MSPKPPGSVVTMTNHRPGSWAQGPEVGDVLETSTGRRYLVEERHQLGDGRSARARYRCRIMAPGDPQPPEAVWFRWEWMRRH